MSKLSFHLILIYLAGLYAGRFIEAPEEKAWPFLHISIGLLLLNIALALL